MNNKVQQPKNIQTNFDELLLRTSLVRVVENRIVVGNGFLHCLTMYEVNLGNRLTIENKARVVICNSQTKYEYESFDVESWADESCSVKLENAEIIAPCGLYSAYFKIDSKVYIDRYLKDFEIKTIPRFKLSLTPDAELVANLSEVH